jgi:hypothetical protein
MFVFYIGVMTVFVDLEGLVGCVCWVAFWGIVVYFFFFEEDFLFFRF